MSDPDREFVLARYPTAYPLADDELGPLVMIVWESGGLSEIRSNEAAAWASAAERIRKQEAKEQAQ